jgi:PKD repeat protein
VTGAVNQSLIFDGSRSADTPSDLKNLVHVWDFGDGTGGDGAVRKHAFAKAGDYTVTLTVIDDDGARSSDTLVARVEDRPNLPPAIRPIRDVFVRLGEPWPLNLEPYISDDNLSSLLLATDSPYAQPFPTNETRLALRLHYTDPLVRTETVKVSVDDGQYNASGTLNVTVVENDWPPEPVGEIPAQVMKEDEEKRAAFSAKDFFTDRDANDTLEYTAVAPPEVSVTVESDLTVTIKGAKDWFGTVTASIRAVDDASAWYEQPFKIVVEAVNDAPFVVFQPTNVNVRLGEEWRFGLADVFDDVDDITLTYTSSDPAVKVDPATGAATWRPSTAEESVEVAFTAKDREGLAVSTSKIKLVAVRAGLDPATVSLGALLAILLTLIFTFLYLRHVWKFQVHEVFVVTEAGLLASHVSSSRSRVVHQELVAAMLTAIRKFVQESFGEEKQAERGLGRLDYEGFVISVEQGKGFFVAIVLSGADSPPLRKKMRSAVAALEARWGEVLKDWDGDEERVEGMDELVRREFELAKQDSSVINLQERADENSGEEGESREGSPGEDRDDERDGDPGGDRGSDSGGEGDEEPSEESEGAKEEQNESPKEESSA